MAVKAALDTVRESFGWAYGSYWQVHSTTNVLHFETESGDAGAEFREVTLSASFKEGVGLEVPPRSWKAWTVRIMNDAGEATTVRSGVPRGCGSDRSGDEQADRPGRG